MMSGFEYASTCPTIERQIELLVIRAVVLVEEELVGREVHVRNALVLERDVHAHVDGQLGLLALLDVHEEHQGPWVANQVALI